MKCDKMQSIAINSRRFLFLGLDLGYAGESIAESKTKNRKINITLNSK